MQVVAHSRITHELAPSSYDKSKYEFNNEFRYENYINIIFLQVVAHFRITNELAPSSDTILNHINIKAPPDSITGKVNLNRVRV